MKQESVTAQEIKGYFESNSKAVSSPMTVFGSLSSYGRSLLDRYANLFRHRRILDAGAGFGVIGSYLHEKYSSNVVSMDFANYVNRIPRRFCPVQADLLCLPFADGCFDSVVCFEVIEHTLDMEGCIREISRVLTDGGQLLLSVPNYLNPAGILKKVLEISNIYEKNSFAPFDEWEPKIMEQFVTSVSITNLLKKNFFHIRKIEGAEIFDAMFPWANKIPGLFYNSYFLNFRELMDSYSSLPIVKCFALHTLIHAIK